MIDHYHFQWETQGKGGPRQTLGDANREPT